MAIVNTVASATPASRNIEVSLDHARTIRQMIVQSMAVARIAPCCRSERRVNASSKSHNGASIVYAAEWMSEASVTGYPDSAFRIGLAPTIAVPRTRITGSATAIVRLENLTRRNLF